jgi:hypothetical protein
MTEKHTCPRRIEQPGPWALDQNVDTWRTDRWTRWNELQSAIGRLAFRLGMRRTRFGISPLAGGGDTWPWSDHWQPPRSCSFCGGAHPDDAITLARAGWKLEATGKMYKFYLNPPGCRASYPDPAPPVKLYAQHFTPEQFKVLIRKTGGSDASPDR